MVVEPSEDGTGHFSGWNVAMAKASCLVVAGTDEAMERPCVVPMALFPRRPFDPFKAMFPPSVAALVATLFLAPYIYQLSPSII